MPIITKSRLFFTLIFLLAFFLRAYRIDFMEFKADEALNTFLITRAHFGNPIPPGGTVSSVGILNPPLFTYLLLPITLFTVSPVWIALTIALANSLAVSSLFLIISRFYNKTIGIFASLLLCMSPWHIIFSRKIWTQNLLFPLAVLLFYSLHSAVIQKKQHSWIYAGLSLMLMAQLHQGSILLLILFIIYSLLSRIHVSWKHFIFGVLLGALPLIPYLFFQLTKLCIGCAAYTASSHPLNLTLLTHLILPSGIFGFSGFDVLLGNDFTLFTNTYFPISLTRYFTYPILLLTFFGAFIHWRSQKKLRILTFLYVALPSSFVLLRFDIFMHYYLPLLPLTALFIGIAFYTCITCKNSLIRIGGYFLFLSLSLSYILFSLALHSFIAIHKEIHGEYGRVFLLSKAVAESKLRERKRDIAYKEMVIASYVPLQSVIGPETIARVVYDPVQTKKNLPTLEKNLLNRPFDDRILLELTAFYTQKPITFKTLSLLSQKSKINPGYIPIFNAIADKFVNEKGLKRSDLGL